jgi:uracil-DNA glycosylase family 4
MNLSGLNQRVIACTLCPRLRAHCETIAREKRKQFKDEQYWGKPVPGFGDPRARLLVVGLAPAAHGANRTGRMFTGDQSGVWLYRALHRAGFANQPTSEHAKDGLKLLDAYVTAVVRCAPPDNKPSKEEIASCSQFLREELEILTKIRAFLVLGRIALQGLWAVLPEELKPARALPRFSHGQSVRLRDGRLLICSYHPSQQNTFTGKLTEPMFDSVFRSVSDFLRADR